MLPWQLRDVPMHIYMVNREEISLKMSPDVWTMIACHADGERLAAALIISSCRVLSALVRVVGAMGDMRDDGR